MICLAKGGNSVSSVWVEKKENQVKYYVVVFFKNSDLLGQAASSMSELKSEQMDRVGHRSFLEW